MSVAHYRREVASVRAQAKIASAQDDRAELDRLASRMFILRVCAAVEGVSWGKVEREARSGGVPAERATLEVKDE
jgi:hypothetical protein